MTTTPNEETPPTVARPIASNQGGETWDRWSWVSRAAWTKPMLSALERGVKGNVWFSLIDKVWSEATLMEAATRVVSNRGAAGVDHVGTEQFERDMAGNVARLSAELKAGTYRPQSVRRVHIPKPGTKETRPLGIPTVRDRVAQGAVRLVIEPVFEKEFAQHSYGFRPGLGCKDALRRVDGLLKQGFLHVVDADLKSYFDTIPHERLMARVKERIADGRMLALIESFLKAGILDGLERWTPEAGAPQGAVLSPLLSNVYLNPLDHAMAAAGLEMVRYADDFVVMCRTAEEAQRALEMVQAWTAEAGLVLHPAKTRIVDVREDGFEFLGYRFTTGKDGHVRRQPRAKSLKKLQDVIRAKTRRTNGHSMERIVKDVNLTLVGWFGYFQQSMRTGLRELDAWIRMRLRSVLRRRCGRRGRGRGLDHNRWTNDYFHGIGLFNLTSARDLIWPPSRR